MARVFYVGGFSFPTGDAAAARVLGIGKALRSAGHEVTYAGWEREGRAADRLSDGRYCYQGFPYFSQNEFRHGQLSSVRRLAHYFGYGGRTLHWLASQSLRRSDVVIAYGGQARFLTQLSWLCYRTGARLIVDRTEWYDPDSLVGGRWGVVRWDQELTMRGVTRHVGHVIAISSFLARYYTTRGCHVVRVPPLVDLQDPKWTPPRERTRRDGPMRLVYAGSPGRKDLLAVVLRALRRVIALGHPVRMQLIGPDRQKIWEVLGRDASLLEELSQSVDVSGRVPQETVPALLAEADFSLLVRPNARYAEAGFPTKLVESLSAGVPAIVNQTSDIGSYVRDRQEGVVLLDSSEESVVRGLRDAWSLGPQRWAAMRTSAREQAERCFDYRRHATPLGGFIDECLKAKGRWT